MSTEPNPTPFFADAVGPWHDHFAWLPISTYDQHLCWLRWVKRRCVWKQHHLIAGAVDAWFQYHDEPQELRAAIERTQAPIVRAARLFRRARDFGQAIRVFLPRVQASKQPRGIFSSPSLSTTVAHGANNSNGASICPANVFPKPEK